MSGNSHGIIKATKRDAKDLGDLLNDYRAGKFTRDPEETPIRRHDNRKSHVVCFLGNVTGRSGASAMILDRPSGTAYEVLYTGITSGDRTSEFGVQVSTPAGSTIAFIPFDASPEVFAERCGFDSSVSVTLGTYPVPGDRDILLGRWRVEFSQDGYAISSYSSQDSEDYGFDESMVSQVCWVGTDRILDEVFSSVPNVSIPPFTETITPDTLEWNDDLDRWEITRPADAIPSKEANGEAGYWRWVDGQWRKDTPYVNWMPLVDGITVWPKYDSDAGIWYIVDENGDPIPHVPDNYHGAVWLVYEAKTWRQMKGSRWLEIFAYFHNYGYGWGYWGWGGGGTFGNNIFDTQFPRRGCIGLVVWTGHAWVVSDFERYRFEPFPLSSITNGG